MFYSLDIKIFLIVSLLYLLFLILITNDKVFNFIFKILIYINDIKNIFISNLKESKNSSYNTTPNNNGLCSNNIDNNNNKNLNFNFNFINKSPFIKRKNKILLYNRYFSTNSNNFIKNNVEAIKPVFLEFINSETARKLSVGNGNMLRRLAFLFKLKIDLRDII